MRANRWSTLRLLGTLRGEGVLIGLGAETAVRYQIELFKRGAQETAAGEVERLQGSLRGEPCPARLRLSDGVEIAIALTDVRADVATFDVDEADAAHCHRAG